jgi:tight adherence protein C
VGFGSAEFMLFVGLLLAGGAVYLFLSSLLAGRPGESQLSWASGTEPVKSKNGVINLCRPLVHQFTMQHQSRWLGE